MHGYHGLLFQFCSHQLTMKQYHERSDYSFMSRVSVSDLRNNFNKQDIIYQEDTRSTTRNIENPFKMQSIWMYQKFHIKCVSHFFYCKTLDYTKINRPKLLRSAPSMKTTLTQCGAFQVSSKSVNEESSTKRLSYNRQVKRIFSPVCQDLSQC